MANVAQRRRQLSNVETIVGRPGRSDDDRALATTLAVPAPSVDLGAGSDQLTLANGANTLTLANVETVVGGSGADTVTLSAVIANGSIDLGSGAW